VQQIEPGEIPPTIDEVLAEFERLRDLRQEHAAAMDYHAYQLGEIDALLTEIRLDWGMNGLAEAIEVAEAVWEAGA